MTQGGPMRFDNLTQDSIKKKHRFITYHLASHSRISRRTFLEAAAGGTWVIGGAIGSGFLRPTTVLADPGIGNVLPIPTTRTAFGVDIHVQAPPFTGPNTDPATVWNFQGASGIAFIDTTATQAHRQTDVVQEGLDGRPKRGHGNPGRAQPPQEGLRRREDCFNRLCRPTGSSSRFV